MTSFLSSISGRFLSPLSFPFFFPLFLLPFSFPFFFSLCLSPLSFLFVFSLSLIPFPFSLTFQSDAIRIFFYFTVWSVSYSKNNSQAQPTRTGFTTRSFCISLNQTLHGYRVNRPTDTNILMDDLCLEVLTMHGKELHYSFTLLFLSF